MMSIMTKINAYILNCWVISGLSVELATISVDPSIDSLADEQLKSSTE